MKRMGALLAAMLLGLCCLCGCGGGTQDVSIFSRPTPAEKEGKGEWLDVQSFVCNYGPYQPDMEKFDVAICESRNLGAEGIKKLNDAGVYTICYITVGEDDSLNVGDGLGTGGLASYYLYKDGAPQRNETWNSYYVDAGSPVWQAKILAKAGEILALGADGLFLDTLDTVDVNPATLAGMVDLVKKLHETYPDAKLVANRGFSLLEYIAPYLSGMMFESFNTGWNFETGQSFMYEPNSAAYEYNVATAVNTINKNRQMYYFPVFALDYVNKEEIGYLAQTLVDRSWAYDFIPYLTTSVKLDLITLPYATPQSARGSLALKGEGNIAQEAGKPDGDTSAANIAYVGNGATVAVDSYYSADYRANKTAAINDGFHNVNMYWGKRAWASNDEKPEGDAYTEDHWIEFTFPEAKAVTRANIWWECDDGAYYPSQEIVIEAWIGGDWQEVTHKSGIASSSAVTELSFTAPSSTKLRIRQPAGKGVSYRKGIMWVMEVELYAD